VAATFAAHTWSRADAGEHATDLVRVELTTGLAQHRHDFETTKAAVQQLYDEAFPAFARELGITKQQFDQQITAQYPAVAALLSPEPRRDSLAFAEGIVSNLERHQDDFNEADALPVDWLPLTVAPWLAFGFGSLLAIVGAWALVRPTAVAVAAIGLLGLLAVLGPLVVRFPQKASAANSLLATLNVTPAIAAHTRAVLVSARSANEELEQRVYPDLARSLRITSPELDARISERYPALAAARLEFNDLFQRYERRVAIRETGLTIVPEAKKFPLTSVTWWSTVPGGLTAISAGVALALSRRRSRSADGGQAAVAGAC
jgi:hypothetical protein